MAQSSNNGGARSVSPTDFNDRVKRLLADKPEIASPKAAQKARQRPMRPGPRD